MYLEKNEFEDFLIFDVILQSSLGSISRKMLFPINYSEKNVWDELKEKYPELSVEEVCESDYVLHLK